MRSTWATSETLEPATCLQLLASVRVGRVAWTAERGPQVLPVNHTVLDGEVLFRTDIYSSLAEATREGTVAFQADELDDRMQSGWSVLVVGPATHVEDPDEMSRLFRRMDEPWAPGSRPLVARIRPLDVTGRRFVKA